MNRKALIKYLLAGISARVKNVIEEYRPTQDIDLESAVRRRIEEFIYRETKRRPMVIPVLTTVTFHKIDTWEKGVIK